MTEPLWNHGDHGGATAVYAVQAPQWHRVSGVTGVLAMVHKIVRGLITADLKRHFSFAIQAPNSAVRTRGHTSSLKQHGIA